MQDCFCEANGKDTSLTDRKNKDKRLLTQKEKLKSEVTYTFTIMGQGILMLKIVYFLVGY